MKTIAILSGKGGTGKTTLAASLARLAGEKALADCDVEAPNLHILLQGKLLEKKEYRGAQTALIDEDLCRQCGLCREACRFQAISAGYQVIPFRCEGCGVCSLVCPHGAAHLETVKTGDTYVHETGEGLFSHALLDIGAEGSGKLVTEVRRIIQPYIQTEKLFFIDGSPGIGCVVIASLTGCDAAILVTEPTLSGKSDLLRVLDLADHFSIPAVVCINRFDVNLELTAEIEAYCRQARVPVLGKIPFDSRVVEGLRNYKTPLEMEGSTAAAAIRGFWENMQKYLQNEEEGE